MSRAVVAAGLAAALLATRAAAAASPAALRDFLVQDVCLDRAGGVVTGVAPIGDPRCAGRRDLQPSERLPYHKHDHPGFADRQTLPQGYQRHDSFPVATAGFGIVVEQSFDFGAGEGRRFGVFDEGRGDGGDIDLVDGGTASIAATEDGGAGFQLFVGPHCQGRVDRAALAGAWIIARSASGQPQAGDTVARLADLKQGRQSACPARLNTAFTRWYLRDIAYRAAPGQGPPVTLQSLVSEHYGGRDPASAPHVERFYFTRELGATRWERWQNLKRAGWFGAGRVERAADDLAGSGRCGPAPAPAGGAHLVMVDCREWTLIVPPNQAGGDDPRFFVDAIRRRGLAADLFAAPDQAGFR